METITVAVGTKNPCKISAVQKAFSETFPDCQISIQSHSVPSGVSDQPFGDEETKLGAMNRARAAFNVGNTGRSNTVVDFGVGLEGGIEIVEKDTKGKDGAIMIVKELWCMAYMCIIGTGSESCTRCKHPSSTYIANADANASEQSKVTKELIGIAKTAAFPLPRQIAHLVLDQHMELGHADDALFQRVNSKQGSGTVGMLTKNMVDRSEYYDHALRMALIPFIWPEHYLPDL